MGKKNQGGKAAEGAGPAAAAAAAAGGVAATAAEQPKDMVFESADFRVIPAGVQQVLLKIARAGDHQGASLGVAVFEQLTPQSQFVVIAKKMIDNLASTPEESFLPLAPVPGATYAITFVGEMHALSLANAPLSLTLRINGEGIGAPIEDFGGPKEIPGRFCVVRGRALLRAAA
jgi:hypothetical protein